PHFHATLTPNIDKVPSLADEYAVTLGVVIEKGDKLALYSLQSDSDIYTTINNRFYLGLAESSTIGIGTTKEKLHVVRSNVPFELTQQGNTHQLVLKSAGLQQVKVFSPTELLFDGSSEVKIEHDAQTHMYTITRYGDLTTLSFNTK
ncbi:VCBS repeat-containing protein, partial [Paenibacillus sp. TAF58]